MAAKVEGTQKVTEVVATFRPCRQFKAPGNASYTSIDFDDTGEFALLARSDDTIQLFNTRAGAQAKELKSQKYGNALARFTHHSTSIVYASTKVDDGIRYLSMHDNSFIRYFRGHTDRVTSLCISPSNDQMLSASMDDTIKLWDLRTPNAQGELKFHCPWLAAFDPSASVIAVASPPCQTIVLYDFKNYDKPPFATFDLAEIEAKLERYGQVPGEGWTGIEFSNNGKHILVSTNGPGHYVLDAYSGELQHYLSRPSGTDNSHIAPGDALPLPQENITPSFIQSSACFAPDGNFVIGSNGGQSGLLVWNLEEKIAVNIEDRVLKPNADLPSQRSAKVVAYNPRYNFIATADKDMTMWLGDDDLV